MQTALLLSSQLKDIVKTSLHTLNWVITLIQLKAHSKSNSTLKAFEKVQDADITHYTF